MPSTVRPEEPKDRSAIYALIKRAFANAPFTDHKEQDIVDKLRASNNLTLSLVIEDEGKLIAYAAISPVNISDGSTSWYGLGPVAVEPEYQGKGFGTKIITSILTKLEQLGGHGCVVLGNPDFYSRFGFKAAKELVLKGVPAEYFQSLLIAGSLPQGEVYYHKAFFE